VTGRTYYTTLAWYTVLYPFFGEVEHRKISKQNKKTIKEIENNKNNNKHW
jgi:hypothetical protein